MQHSYTEKERDRWTIAFSDNLTEEHYRRATISEALKTGFGQGMHQTLKLFLTPFQTRDDVRDYETWIRSHNDIVDDIKKYLNLVINSRNSCDDDSIRTDCRRNAFIRRTNELNIPLSQKAVARAKEMKHLVDRGTYLKEIAEVLSVPYFVDAKIIMRAAAANYQSMDFLRRSPLLTTRRPARGNQRARTRMVVSPPPSPPRTLRGRATRTTRTPRPVRGGGAAVAGRLNHQNVARIPGGHVVGVRGGRGRGGRVRGMNNPRRVGRRGFASN